MRKDMRKMAILMCAVLTASTVLGTPALAADGAPPTPPSGAPGQGSSEAGPGQGGPGGASGQNPPGGAPGSSAGSVTYSATRTISTDTTESGQTVNADSADQIALLADGATVTENELTVSKTGDSDGGDNCNFYGQNAAVLAKGGAVLTIDGGTITSSASGANGVFSYGGNGGTNGASGDGTTVNVRNVTITTTGNGSGGIMTTGGGIMNAEDLTINTSGGSSAAIRSDRGGGTVRVSGGSYSTSGVGSPAIYSTADISVKGATLCSTASEGVVIEGKNSVTLTDSALTANNTTRNGNATHYDAVMIYQSMSGDADSGTSSFTMTGGSITNSNGEVFHVTNTDAIITLSGVSIVNSGNGVLLDVSNDGWSGASNKATLKVTDQALSGDIIVDSSAVNGNSGTSSLVFSLGDGSSYKGSINGSVSERGDVSMTIASGAIWELTGDSFLTSLSGSGSIDYGSYTLTVGGVRYSASDPYTGLTSSTGQATGLPDSQVSEDQTGTGSTTGGSQTAQTVTFKNTKMVYSASQLSSSAQKFSVIESSGGGKVSAVSYKSGSSRYIKVKSNGKIKVRKGTPAGKYKVTVQVDAAGGYAAARQTIKVVVR